MKKSLAALVVIAIILSCNAFAASLKGVEMKDQIVAEGESLSLQGIGLRKKFLFSVYVGGLYLTTPTKDAAAAINADEPKRISMTFLRDVDADNIKKAFKEGFETNSPEAAKTQSAKIETFLGLFKEEFKEGETVNITYLPATGVTAEKGGKVLGTVEGAEFMKAVFTIWLGKNPPSEDLKKGMLGL